MKAYDLNNAGAEVSSNFLEEVKGVSRRPFLCLILLASVGCGDAGPQPNPAAPTTRKRLFGHSPEWARQMMPIAQADLAFAIYLQKDLVDRSRFEGTGAETDPTKAGRQEIERSLSEIVRPEWQLDGWILQFDYWDNETAFRLEFPEELGEFGVHFSGPLPMGKVEGVKAGDWIRFSAIGGPTTKVGWDSGKDLGSLNIGPLTLTKIERLAPPITTTSGN